MSDIWFCSDLHFGHRNILSYTKRPYVDIENMNDEIIQSINRFVKSDDTLWHLGDLTFAPQAETLSILRKINCKDINLIVGNHDRGFCKYADEAIKKGLIRSYQHYKVINIDKQPIVLFHFPIASWEGMHRGSWSIHGHCHGSFPPQGKSVDVGWDSHWVTGKLEHRPFSFEEIKRFMSKRDIKLVDHHGQNRS